MPAVAARITAAMMQQDEFLGPVVLLVSLLSAIYTSQTDLTWGSREKVPVIGCMRSTFYINCTWGLVPIILLYIESGREKMKKHGTKSASCCSHEVCKKILIDFSKLFVCLWLVLAIKEIMDSKTLLSGCLMIVHKEKLAFILMLFSQ